MPFISFTVLVRLILRIHPKLGQTFRVRRTNLALKKLLAHLISFIKIVLTWLLAVYPIWVILQLAESWNTDRLKVYFELPG